MAASTNIHAKNHIQPSIYAQFTDSEDWLSNASYYLFKFDVKYYQYKLYQIICKIYIYFCPHFRHEYNQIEFLWSWNSTSRSVHTELFVSGLDQNPRHRHIYLEYRLLTWSMMGWISFSNAAYQRWCADMVKGSHCRKNRYMNSPLPVWRYTSSLLQSLQDSPAGL